MNLTEQEQTALNELIQSDSETAQRTAYQIMIGQGFEPWECIWAVFYEQLKHGFSWFHFNLKCGNLAAFGFRVISERRIRKGVLYLEIFLRPLGDAMALPENSLRVKLEEKGIRKISELKLLKRYAKMIKENQNEIVKILEL